MTDSQVAEIRAAGLDRLAEIYRRVWESNDRDVVRDFCLRDRFFLVTQVLGVDVAWHPWVLKRCREVEADPDEHLDLWSRGHFKSTLITFAGVAQEILRNPEICVCIISYKAGAAEAFSAQIKSAFETNEILLNCFPDVLWTDRPDHRGDTWSASDWCVKRTTAKKEATVSTSGLVSGMRTGGHYDLLVYDDVVTPDSVVTTEMSQRTTAAWSMSLNLGVTSGTRHWYIGTRYHVFDTYAEMMRRGIRERRHVCIDGRGRSVLLPEAELARKRREMSTADWNSQMMQTPIGVGELLFRDEWWLEYATAPDPRKMHRYVFVDTATRQGRRNDYTVMWVVGYGRDRCRYLLDCVRDRLTLSQRADAIFGLVERWDPADVFWEANGSRSDGEYIRERMDRAGWRFRITEIEQSERKETRIAWLEPPWRDGKVIAPGRLAYTDVSGQPHDLVRDFREEEWAVFPSVTHDDMLDCLGNMFHPDVLRRTSFPVSPNDRTARPPDAFAARLGTPGGRSGRIFAR